MLDEFKEYEEYQFIKRNNTRKGSKSKRHYRIDPRYFEKGFTTLPRALEIIARKALYQSSINSPDIDAARTALNEWLDQLGTDASLELIGISPNKFNDFIAKINDFKERYNKSSISIKETGARTKININDLNASFWDRTVASALNRGPLKKHMLVEKEKRQPDADIFENVYKQDQRYNDKPGKVRSLARDKGSAKHKENVLKLTAYYLLENVLNQKTVLISKPQLSNWSFQVTTTAYFLKQQVDEQPDSKDSANDNSCKQELFRKTSNRKYEANEDWISQFELVDITKEGSLEEWVNNPENNGKHYYLDRGWTDALEEHVCPELPA